MFCWLPAVKAGNPYYRCARWGAGDTILISRLRFVRILGSAELWRGDLVLSNQERLASASELTLRAARLMADAHGLMLMKQANH